MKLTFGGAAGTVTGSRHLFQEGGHAWLLDCGLFQGYKQLRLRNRAALPVDPGRIGAVVLSHAHLDHSGYLPALVRDGFRGPIYASAATRDLCEILLKDSAHLQEEEARFANRHGFSRHQPAEPLYTVEDALRALRLFRETPFGRAVELGEGVSATLQPAGHLLGAATVRLTRGTRSLLYSGDLGRPNDSILQAPTPIEASDTLILESTYGDRRHAADDGEAILGQLVREAAGAGGSLLVPSFAVGRAQTVMLALSRLKARGDIPDLPVFLDSPMAIDATALYRKYRTLHRLTVAECRAMCGVARLINTPEQSKALANLRMPAVIIAASGMATGGRVLHHLKTMAPDARNRILFVGHQAGGTRGAHLVEGATELKIHGEWYPVRAGVRQMDVWSAHADADEIMAWLQPAARAPDRVFLVHGEANAADMLRQRIEERLRWPVEVPEHLQSVQIDL
ncbi:MAG TPA: MBL fold metallo-hydrolase [Burkholderiaceae bacterium]|nr:MBL fold metallo-hydrolase [Burkholderiaceae bacterium]